jgi:sec-independent protein translocase protein TatA
MRFGFQELLVVLAIVLVIFGASRLPQLGKGLGEGIRNFKKGVKGDDDNAVPGKSDGKNGQA